MRSTRRYTFPILAATIALCGATPAGCAGRPGQTRSGFLSDYDGLRRINDAEYARVDVPALAALTGFSIEETRVLVAATPDGTAIPADDITEIEARIRTALAKSLGTDYTLSDSPGPGIGRVRVAITEVKKPATLLNIHPASKLTGAGLGGATIECEILDHTGRQIAALVEPRKGDQFEFDTLSEFDDAMDAIDAWADAFRKRIDRARGQPVSKDRPGRD